MWITRDVCLFWASVHQVVQLITSASGVREVCSSPKAAYVMFGPRSFVIVLFFEFAEQGCLLESTSTSVIPHYSY